MCPEHCDPSPSHLSPAHGSAHYSRAHETRRQPTAFDTWERQPHTVPPARAATRFFGSACSTVQLLRFQGPVWPAVLCASGTVSMGAGSTFQATDHRQISEREPRTSCGRPPEAALSRPGRGRWRASVRMTGRGNRSGLARGPQTSPPARRPHGMTTVGGCGLGSQAVPGERARNAVPLQGWATGGHLHTEAPQGRAGPRGQV